ncbi:MAG: hypothetical protein IKD55_00940 [Sediminibacterium sp.]|nr:hypothetical protein [Sediminibacterium sp.]
MLAKLRRKWLYLRYWLKASNGRGHGIHSPFVFKLTTEVLNDTRTFYAFEMIANTVELLLADNTWLKEDRQLCNAGDQIKYGELLFRLVHYFSPQQILEIGHSFGITTAYMAAAKETANVVALIPDSRYASLTSETCASLQRNNISLKVGNIDNTLQPLLQTIRKVDLCYMHNCFEEDGFMRYFDQVHPFLHEFSVLVIHPIRMDDQATKNWKAMVKRSDIKLTIDLFDMGLIFFRKGQYEKEHFAIRF